MSRLALICRRCAVLSGLLVVFALLAAPAAAQTPAGVHRSESG
jgi:hypothetical protein